MVNDYNSLAKYPQKSSACFCGLFLMSCAGWNVWLLLAYFCCIFRPPWKAQTKMISFGRIENCPSLTFNLILFFWWIGLCILYFRQPPVPMPVKIQQYRIENYSDKERRLLQQQNCVRNARPCPRLQFNRTDDHLVDFPNFWYWFCSNESITIYYTERYEIGDNVFLSL